MQISGLQKMTLLDYPGHLSAIVFTPGCNFCCSYCHNSGLLSHDSVQIPEEQVLRELRKRAHLLEGVCISGGEPTLQIDLPDFIRELRAMGYKIKLDTNGSRPEVLFALLSGNLLDYVAMDVKASPERLGDVAGIDPVGFLPAIRESMQLLRSARIPYEFRTTLIPDIHDLTELDRLGRFLQEESRPGEAYFLQGFRLSGQVPRQDFREASPAYMRAALLQMHAYMPGARLRGFE